MSVTIENEISPFCHLSQDCNVVLHIYIFRYRLVVDDPSKGWHSKEMHIAPSLTVKT